MTSKKVKKTRKKSKAKASVWPAAKRAVLFRPERLEYVRKMIPDQGCVFCHAAKADASLETLCLYKSASSMVILNKYPYNSGHLLVLPKRHCGHLLKLSESEYLDLQQTLRLAFAAMEKAYMPGGINMGFNHGSVAGAGIPEHIHYHLIPRWAGDLNFFPLIADTKVVVETLAQSFERYLPHFQEGK